jgi:hypothetical protein
MAEGKITTSGLGCQELFGEGGDDDRSARRPTIAEFHFSYGKYLTKKINRVYYNGVSSNL